MQNKKIKLKGRQTQSDSPILHDCHITELGPPVTIAMTAKALAAEYAKDKNATITKYHNKYLIISGEVKAVSHNIDKLELELVNGGDVKVVCRFFSYVKPLDEVGYPVKVVGLFRSPEEPRQKLIRINSCKYVSGAR